MATAYKNHYLFVFSAFFLSGCGSMQLSDSDFDNSVNGPPHLEGKIVNGRYSARIGRGWTNASFSVAIPQERDPYEFQHLWRSDHRAFLETSVILGPAALDGTVYRLTVASKDSPPIEPFNERHADLAIQEAEKLNGFPLTKLKEDRVTVNGHPAIFAVYEQIIPDTKGELLPFYHRGLFTHTFYTIDFGTYAAFAWIQATTGGGVNAVDKIEQKKMVARSWEPQEYFVKSIKITP